PMMTHTTVTPRPPHLPYTTLSRSSPSASRTTSRRSCPGDRAWSARPVERDKGEFGGGHLDPPAAALAQYPDLDAQRHRTAPEPDYVGIAAHDIADLDGPQECNVADCGGDDPAFGMAGRGDRAGGIHQRHDPTAEDVARRVGV